MKRKALGRGLGLSALVPSPFFASVAAPVSEESQPTTSQPASIRINTVVPNRFQPRETFDPKSLSALAESLKSHGFIQPIVVRPLSNGTFELIAGERRMRAAALAGFATVPAMIREVNDREMMEYALVENLQREELTPIEKARAYSRLLSEFSLTQEKIAETMRVDRSSVANTLRLLQLPPALWEEMERGVLSMGHAKVLLSLPTPDQQLEGAKQIKEKGLSVRQAEALVKAIVKKAEPESRSPAEDSQKTIHDKETRALEIKLQRVLGTKVRIESSSDGQKGTLLITYYSLDDLDRILEKFIDKFS